MFNPNTRYMFHAEGLEESVMALTLGDVDEWEDMLTAVLFSWTDSDAQKVLSELNQDTTKDGARVRLYLHYADPETRDAVIASWHAAGHYTTGETAK